MLICLTKRTNWLRNKYRVVSSPNWIKCLAIQEHTWVGIDHLFWTACLLPPALVWLHCDIINNIGSLFGKATIIRKTAWYSARLAPRKWHASSSAMIEYVCLGYMDGLGNVPFNMAAVAYGLSHIWFLFPLLHETCCTLPYGEIYARVSMRLFCCSGALSSNTNCFYVVSFHGGLKE